MYYPSGLEVTELVLCMAVAIALLLGLLWFSIKRTAKAIIRAEQAEASLSAINKAHQAIKQQLDNENKQHETHKKRVADRNYFAD